MAQIFEKVIFIVLIGNTIMNRDIFAYPQCPGVFLYLGMLFFITVIILGFYSAYNDYRYQFLKIVNK